MTKQKYRRGDEVQHKSGGPKMVVKGYEPTDGEEVTCEWMNKEHMPIEKAFHQNTLRFYPSQPLISTRTSLP